MRTLRRTGPLLLLAGLLSLLAATFGGGTSGADPMYNATLKAAHVGATNPGFETEGEEGESGCPSPGWGWHFVLGGNADDNNFVAVKATFEDAGDITTFESFPTGKHAYVYTPGPDTLLGAVFQVNGTDFEVNLSHVCTGPATTTTTTAVEETTTTTAVEETTTTTEPEETTTTTEVQSSTTEADTTTTTEVQSSTTEADTTTTTGAEEPTTTTQPASVAPSSIDSEPTSTTDAPVVVNEATPRPAVSSGTLPRTGSSSRTLASTGFALLLLGTVVLLRSRSLARR